MRKTNPELIAEFRELLTEGAKTSLTAFADKYHCRDFDETEVLEETKEWRSSLWKKLNEIEERMCPRPPGT